MESAMNQYLVRFDHNATYLIELEDSDSRDDVAGELRRHLQQKIFPLSFPSMDIRPPVQAGARTYFVTASSRGFIRGGKGGFGTLLKGQSKQASAKVTLDFGACRDLQGRRLRHVNDEIKLRKWRESSKNGAQQMQDEWNTPSGIRNWHLGIPNWSEGLSNKGKRQAQQKLSKDLQEFQEFKDSEEQAKLDKERRHQEAVSDYVSQGKEVDKNVMTSAIAQGLQKKKKERQEQKEKKRKAAAIDSEKSDQEEPSMFCTLSGEVMIFEDDTTASDAVVVGTYCKSGVTIQSQSEFCTAAVLLDTIPPLDSRGATLSYSVILKTGGLAQIGWADARNFHPENDSGDGVGDDDFSYAYDGSRCLRFHGSKEEWYGGSTPWAAGDSIECFYSPAKGEIWYTSNGKHLGVAFDGVEKGALLIPAVSCNQGEILSIRLGQGLFSNLKEKGSKSSLNEDSKVPKEKRARSQEPTSNNQEATDMDNNCKKKLSSNKYFSVPANVEPVDLDLYESVEELLNLQRDRLVGALSTRGVNAQGSQEDLAKQLFALKGECCPAQHENDEAKKSVSALQSATMTPVDLDSVECVEDLMALGLDRLKGALSAIGVKSGGSLEERANRLFSLKGLKREDYPKMVQGKDFVV